MPVDPTAVAGKRTLAWIIDGIIFVILSNALQLAFGSSRDVTSRDFSGDETAAKAFCSAWKTTHDGICIHSGGNVTAIQSAYTGLWIFAALFVIFVIYQGLMGASLGKQAMGLRIVKADGAKAGVVASAVRTVLWVVDAITCGLPIVGGTLMLSTTGHRRVGDMGAGTYVVPAAFVGHPVILPGQAGWGTYTQGPPPSGPYQPGPYQPGPYQPTGPAGGYGAVGEPGAPVVLPPGVTPGEPTSPPANPQQPAGQVAPWAPTAPTESRPEPGAEAAGASAQTTGTGDYEADKPIWDPARNAYIQYDSARAEWLEYDERAGRWNPISR